MSESYVIFLDEQQRGPVTIEDLNRMWSEKLINDETPVRRENEEENWHPWNEIRRGIVARDGKSRPTLLASSASDETFAGVTYHLDGELVPALTVELTSTQSVYFEHHILLWKHPTVTIGIRAMKGVFKRMMAGMQIFITEAQGPGQIAFSRDAAGHVFATHLKKGEEMHIREHQFLAATGNIDYTFERVRGVANMLFGGTGFFIDKFHGAQGDGIIWLHGYGNVFEKVLAPGESIDVEPGGSVLI